ncbi:glycosyltransferase [Enterococcus avium]|uniref:Glycosyltransferase n=1 Tax=Enterococcus avium TaxID=33945 RepID=A0ABD5F5A7_ENTAV|nr:glycosyltransferase [Enterococcus avium]MDT2397241.1 glycosyltransferase [Enterococcus avium]MDT2435527.1 glycosyltransferase [Enterococcus avium]MDT2448102.1 glycosyltransferase [Enterococcus avium]MDT2457664.1 glycosyltransferase [Enterococcus avium]MDT2464709.1 glycosyltransferase [Enterococcus avium]
MTGSHIQLTAVSIASIINNYFSEDPLDILIVVSELGNEEILRLKSIPKFCGKTAISITIWYPPQMAKQIKNYNNARFPEVTLWRLFLPAYFSNYESILYLDNDTIVYDDVSTFFDLVPEEKAIAAVRDFYFSVISDKEDSAKYFGIKTMKNHFNSGFLLFNVSKFNELISSEKILAMINGKEYVYLDQTILNILCEKHVHFLPYEYNYQKDDHWLFDWAKKTNPLKFLEIEKARENIKVRHFVEFEQHSLPWEHLLALDQWEREFWDYLLTIKTLETHS